MTGDSITQFYAPSMRLIDVDTGTMIGGTATPLDPGTTDWAAWKFLDIVSARVTLVNSGVSQLQVVLNNMIYDGNGMPAVPPWQYNALDLVRFGQIVRLDMRYGDQPWTKMILAQINDLDFSFPSSGGAQLTLIAEDLLCRLKRKPRTDTRYDAGRTEEQIVRDVLTRAGDTTKFTGTGVVPGGRDSAGFRQVRGPLVEWPAITEELPSVSHQKSQTYLQFLQNIADRLDFEIFVDFAKNYLPLDENGEVAGEGAGGSDRDTDPNEVLFHFEPARSLLKGGPPDFVVDLAWSYNLVEFHPKLKAWDLPTEIEVKGRSPATVEVVKHLIDVIDFVIQADLGKLDDTEPDLVPSSALRATYFQDIPTPDSPMVIDFTNLGRERAIYMGAALLRQKHREMLTVEATTIGFPSIRAGTHVDVSLMYAPFDGLYYVTKAVHSFDSGGYKTQLSLRRPGLQPPEQYAWSLASGRVPGVKAAS